MGGLSLEGRLALYGHVAEGFFGGADALAGATGVAAPVIAALAGLVRLSLDAARSDFEAALAAPLHFGGPPLSVPSPAEALAYFRDAPEPPELAEQFAPEVAAGDWRALQRAHGILTEVLILRRPLLRAAFALELSRRDYRGLVQAYPPVRAALERLARAPEIRGALRRLVDQLRGEGTGPRAPDETEAAAHAYLESHWRALLAAAQGGVS